MSLINDALRKAQKQRTGDSPPLASLPGVGGESAARIAKRDKPTGFNAPLLQLVLGAGGVLLVLVLGGVFFVRAINRPPAAPSATDTTARGATALPSDGNGPQPAGSLTGAKTTAKPAIIFSLPVARSAGPEAAPAPVPSITASAGGDSLPSAAAAGKTVEMPKPVDPPVKLDPKAITFIESLHIAGIRASATDSKVLMNDRVYRIGDYVEHTLGLKLTGITTSSLTFEDERGGLYTRNF